MSGCDAAPGLAQDVDSGTRCEGEARIVLVDDHATLREAVAMLINNEADLCVSGQATCISEALELCATLKPDMALIDISLKGEDGLDLVRQLQQSAPDVSCIVLSLHGESHYIKMAREAGARGYAVKSQGARTVLHCVRSVRDGGTCFASPNPS